jgi:hypothetical protein
LKLAVHDLVSAEVELLAGWWMVKLVDLDGGHRKARFVRLKGHPFAREQWHQRLRDVLGRDLVLWFLWPERVRKYGKRPSDESDLPLCHAWRQFELDEDSDEWRTEVLDVLDPQTLPPSPADRTIGPWVGESGIELV